MSATVAYRCDRCTADAEVPVVEGQPVPLPAGWGRLGLEATPVMHLCAPCLADLGHWFARTEGAAIEVPTEAATAVAEVPA